MGLVGGLIWIAGVRAVRSPLVVGLSAVIAVIVAAGLWRTMTVWASASAAIGVGAAAVGFGGLVVATDAVLRESRRDFSELLDCARVGRSLRLLALVGGCTCGVGLISAVLAAVMVAVGGLDTVSIGHVGWPDVTSGVTTAMLLTAIGGVATAMTRSAILAPAIAIVAFLAFVAMPDLWLLPVVPEQGLFVLPQRPPIWHSLYGAVLLATVVATLPAGLSRSIGSILVLVVSLCASIILGAATLNSDSHRALLTRGDPHRQADVTVTELSTHCIRHAVQLCSIAEFAPWIPLWEQAVWPVAGGVPPAVRESLPAVRQETLIGQHDRDLSPYLPVGLTWGNHGEQEEDIRSLAGAMAAAAVGFPVGTSRYGTSGCDGSGQARTVLALWLESRAIEPGTQRDVVLTMRDRYGKSSLVTVHSSDLGAVRYSAADIDLAKRMHAMTGVEGAVWARWSELTDPSTPSAVLATMFHVSVVGQLTTDALGRCP